MPIPRLTSVLAAACRALRACALATAVAMPGAGSANPQGAQVLNGVASFAMPDAATLNITSSPGAIINWQQFGISPGEVTRFLQEGAASAVLNRVVGGDPSAILGSLLSNGQVFLINPNGVVFGANAVVNTAGLVVSSLNMTDGDFLAGRLHFSGGAGAGALDNAGRIHSSGSVVLIAPRIENSGIIETEGGGLLLAAGHEVTITSLENPEITYRLAAPDDAVVNLGKLISHGGVVSAFADSIRHSGDIDASGVSVDAGGRVRLVARADVVLEAGSRIRADGGSRGGDGGVVHVESESGRLGADAAAVSAVAPAGAGGRVALLGREVVIEGASRVDASGASGGGTVLAGGDFQGATPDVPNAVNTGIGRDTVLRADATVNGDGGKVIVWADQITLYRGAASARGGAGGGDGGFIEVSGKRDLQFLGSADAAAPAGAAGTILLDPDVINIVPGFGADDAQVADGQIFFTDGGTGTFTIGAATLAGLAGSINLEANVSISTGALSLPNIAAGETLTLNAGNNISSNGIATGGGNLVIVTTTSGFSNGGAVTTSGGDITINSFYDFFAGLDSGGGNILVNGTGRVRTPLTIGTGGGNLDFNGTVTNNGQAANVLTLDLGDSGDMLVTGTFQPVTTVSNARALTFNGTVTGDFTQIAGTGATTFNGNFNATNLSLGGNDFVFNAGVTANSLTTATGGYSVAFNAGGTITSATTFTNTGTLTLGNDAADVLTFGNGLTATAPATINAGGRTVSSTGDLTLGGNAVTVLGTGVLQSAANVTINAASTVTVNGAVNGVNMAITSGTGLLSVGGSVDASGAATLTANAAGMSIGGTVGSVGSVALNTSAAGVTMSPAGSVTGSSIAVTAQAGASLGRLDAGTGNVAVTVNAGAITDANGAAVNVIGNGATLSGQAGVGSLADPLETQVATLDVSTGGADLAIANTGDLSLVRADPGRSGSTAALRTLGALTLAGAINAAPGNVTLRGSTGLDTAGNFVSGASVTLDGGDGTALLNFSNVNASGLLSVLGNEIDIYSSNVGATDISLVSTALTHVTAGEGSPALVDASNDINVLAGSLLVEGGSASGDSAKLNAGNAVTINAGNVTVRGGSADFADASIDPVTLTINAAGTIAVQGGSGANSGAELLADTLVALTAAGGVSILGGVSPAVVRALTGNVTINTPGAVLLAVGANPNGDALIVANNGAGAVQIRAASCTGCVLLGVNPFGNAGADLGAFAGSLDVIFPGASPVAPVAVAGGGATGESNDINADEVLVLRDLRKGLEEDVSDSNAEESEEREEDDRQCR